MTHRLASGLLAVGLASVVPPGSPSEVASAVKASIAIQTIPSDLTPSLQSIAGGGNNSAQNYMTSSCDALVTPSLLTKPAACFYGDLASKRTVILYGDSNAGNWAPAADLAGKSLGFRLALIAMSGCDAGLMNWATHPIPGQSLQARENCDEWHSHLSTLTRTLHPAAVLFVSAGWVWPTPAGWNASVDKAFKVLSLGSPKAKRVVVGTTPDFNFDAGGSVPACLASHTTAVQQCDVTYLTSKSFYAEIQARDKVVATATKAELIPVARWLCSRKHCSPIIKDFLVYVDDDHFSVAYSQWLAGVFGSALKKAAGF